MNRFKGITSNIVISMAGQLVTWASTLILAAAYGRFLGSTGFGELYLATTFTALIGFPIEFSFNQQIIRDVAREPHTAHRYITMGLTLKSVLWVVLFIVALALSVLLGYSPEVRLLIAITGLMLASTAVSSTLVSIQTAYMQPGLAKFGTVIEKVIDAVVAIILLRAGAGVVPVALVLLFGSLAGMVWQIVRVARMMGIRIEWDTQVARTLIHSGMAFLAYGVIGVIYYRVDTVLLSIFGTSAVIGVYGAAYRLFDTLTFVPGIVVASVMAPVLAKHSVDADKSKMRFAVEKTTIAMLLCSLPAAAGLVVTAPNIIGFVYHRQDFVGSAGVLQALALGLVALYLNSVLTTVLVSTGHERQLPLMAIAALIFNVALNFFLIPRYMELGAAWATSLTELLLLGIGLAIIDRSLIPVRLLPITGKIIIASLAMAAVAHALGSFSIFFIIAVSIITYAITILALRVLPREDIERFSSALAPLTRFISQRIPALVASRAWAQSVLERAQGYVPGLAFSEPSQFMGALGERQARDPNQGRREDILVSKVQRLVAFNRRPASDRGALALPGRMPSGHLKPLSYSERENAAILRQRMQTRLAQLDNRQIETILTRAQFGHLSLRMRRIDQQASQHLANHMCHAEGLQLAALPQQGVSVQASQSRTSIGAIQVGAELTRPATYSVEIHRRRPQKRTRDSQRQRNHKEKPRSTAYSGRAQRSSRDVELYVPQWRDTLAP
ncbi:MAG TPA: flippase, partial [Ktedonobacterales bacterium]|nr:flippase [Ktedonobacterales bacterium]